MSWAELSWSEILLVRVVWAELSCTRFHLAKGDNKDAKGNVYCVISNRSH